VFGADNDGFHPMPAADYANHQSVSGLTVAAHVYTDKDELKTAFGKLDPNKYGVLPVLLVMQNDSDKALRLSDMRITYIRTDRRQIESLPAEDVRYETPSRQPDVRSAPSPLPRIPGLGGGNSKDPLEAWEVQGRAFLVQMLPPHESAHGFVYFRTPHTDGAILYIRGIREAATGQELFFLEIPLDRQ